MKKILFSLTIVLMVGGAIYTVNNYNKTKSPSNYDTKDTQSSSNKSNTNSSSNKPTAELVGINQDSIIMKATDFKLKDLNGNELSLNDLRGKKVFLNFWATWCPPCKAEMPEIEKLYQETKNSDLVILAVDIGEPLSDVKTFIDQNNYNFKVLLDSNQKVAAQYGISAIPTSFFIDKEGNIISKHTGPMNTDQMKEYIKGLDK
ncbi:TlpA family protein disulfide reductase [Clostridium magnum]|uniref:Thiol-disulfide oxidoreductase ResA n=1 Tax=Clostridium magnum DSM 2767 TaxID=1121326 RepID=A0A161VBQ8_9CLOT|nr:TlpA disulfide reductase family protein [Clostridium magnum]KZL91481.1 thiol-disulfide oxidoreductase ResA [Clostridium magnum DSM 2767]SHH44067.1 Peroxiredoxin [Clostridium magnum DSM 2767]